MAAHPLVTALAKALKPPKSPDGTYPANSPLGLAFSTTLPEQVIFAGYDGDVYTRPADNVKWQVLYLDARLHRWMIVEQARVRNSDRVSDDRSPTGDYDYLWVDVEARVASGSRSQSVEAPFLTGEFVRAGDFEAPPSGGGMTGGG
jgi:hypothetical protein